MIKLSCNEKQLVLEATTESYRRTIHQPLHKLYLKSTLEGKIHGDIYFWDDIQVEEIASTIENIVNHFKRYEITIILDNQCKDVLNKKRESDEAFSDLMKQGLETKKNTSRDNRGGDTQGEPTWHKTWKLHKEANVKDAYWCIKK